MNWIILAAVVGALMVLVSKLTRTRGDDTTAAAAAADPPAIGDTHSGGDGGADGDGDGGA